MWCEEEEEEGERLRQRRKIGRDTGDGKTEMSIYRRYPV